jgi:Pyruvate/2-oxoacid:ferredoxin oxidoreductase gamma subunit
MIYHELSVWTRGIIMDKEARDIANCLATAADKAGFYAQFISDYVDDPDRTNCLVRKYARFSDEPIEFKFIYENPHPNWVVLVEETLVKAVNFFRGTYDGAATLVVNSARDPEYLLKFLPESMLRKLSKLVVVDGVSLADQRGSSPWMFVRDLGELAYDRMSTEGALERTPVGMGIAAPLFGALIASTGVIPIDTGAETVADKDAFYRGAQQFQVLDYAEAETQVREATGSPVAGTTA